MRNTKSNDIIIKIITVFLAVVFVLSGVLLGLEIWDNRRVKDEEQGFLQQTITYNGKDYVLKENVETFLVMGLDKYEGDSESDSYKNDKQADFLMLLVFDDDAKKCTAVHINRDTMAEIDVLGVATGEKIDTVTRQIALAHTYGNGKNESCQNTSDAVSRLLNNVKVNHYASLTLDAVGTFNDLVGGVEVTVLDDFSGVDDTLIKGQKITLNGQQALNYVKERYGVEDSTNAKRMNRQKQYLEALYLKTKNYMEEDKSFSLTALAEMEKYIISDRTETQLQQIGKKVKEYEFCGILDIDGETKMGKEFIEFYPDRNFIDEIVIELFYKPKK